MWQSNLTLWADAVEKSPEKFRPHVNLAFTLFQHRAYKEAAEEYVLARSLNPTEPRIHTGLGFTLMEMGNSNSAEQSFRTALQIDPNYIDAKTGLGVLRYRAGQYPEALEYLVPSYPYRRESAQLIAMICDSYLALGHPEKALPILNETARQNLRFHRATMLVQKDIKQARAELQAIVAEKQ